MELLSVGVGFPSHYVDQAAVTKALAMAWAGEGDHTAKALNRIHRATTVEGRHFALPLSDYSPPCTFTQANDTFIDVALTLSEAAVRDALVQAGAEVRDVDLLVMVTTSGMAAPSLDARLINRLEFRSDVKRIPVVGLGCVGGAAGIARCADYVKAFPGHIALLVSVEVCSLTFQRDDSSMENLIATGLFGDGAACAVVAGHEWARERGRRGPRIVASRSIFHEHTEDVLGWRITETGFRVVLRRDLPDVACDHLRHDVEQFLAPHGLRAADVGAWIMHPGGPSVLRRIQETLDIPADSFRYSWDSLRRLGNVSSASVLYVLRDVLQETRPPGTHGVMIGIGPGFSAEMLLFRWE